MRVKGAVRWLEAALAGCFELIGGVGEKLVGLVGKRSRRLGEMVEKRREGRGMSWWLIYKVAK